MTTQAATDDVALTVRVAEEIRGLMGRRNISRVKLAEQLGQSRTYIGRRLSGETAFDLDDLEAIARVFGVPVAALMGVVPMPSGSPPFPTRPRTPGSDSDLDTVTTHDSACAPASVIPLRTLSDAA